MNNPWRITGTREVYANRWIEVREDGVIHPSGNPGIYGVVHFNNLAIGVIPVDGEGNTWLVGQYRYPLKQYSWEIPEGGVPLGENPLHGAQRELLEETGIVATQWTLLLEMHLSNSVSDERALVYVAKGLSFQQACPEETEVLSVKKVPLQEAFRMVMRGEITDSMSVAGLLKLQATETAL